MKIMDKEKELKNMELNDDELEKVSGGENSSDAYPCGVTARQFKCDGSCEHPECPKY